MNPALEEKIVAIKQVVAEFFERPWEDRTRKEKLSHGVLALAFLTTREVIRDRGPLMAAGLAFFTVLAVVPLLSVAASLMTAFGLLDVQSGLYETIQQLFPDAASGVATYLEEAATASAGAVGGIGAISLLVIGLVLFNAIEHTMTRIWRGAHDRSVMMKMLTFYAVISFGPVLLALSVVQTASAQIYLARLGLDVSFVGTLLPLLYALTAFVLLYKIVPNANVSWLAALVGAAFSAVVFEIAKWGFNLYVSQLLMQTYDRVYGTLALIPIGLLWMYIVWLVVLIGAELSFSFQNLSSLMKEEARKLRRRAGLDVSPDVMVVMSVLARVLASFEDAEGPVGVDALAVSTGLPQGAVEELVAGLMSEGVLLRAEGGGYLPASPGEKIDLEEVHRVFWKPPRAEPGSALQGLMDAYFEHSQEFFRDRTGSSLVGGSSTDQD